MNMKTFVVKGSPTLLKAFMEEVNKIGWTPQDIDNNELSNSLLLFNGDNIYLPIGHYWLESKDNIYDDPIFNLPSEWDEALKFASMKQFEEGDYAMCLEGFRDDDNNFDGKSGGKGYSPGYRFEITKISEASDGRIILWGGRGGNGVFSEAVKKITPLQFNFIKIDGYELDYRDEKVWFGCQSFTKDEVLTIEKLLLNPINASITIGKSKIDESIIERILTNFK